MLGLTKKFGFGVLLLGLFFSFSNQAEAITYQPQVIDLNSKDEQVAQFTLYGGEQESIYDLQVVTVNYSANNGIESITPLEGWNKERIILEAGGQHQEEIDLSTLNHEQQYGIQIFELQLGEASGEASVSVTSSALIPIFLVQDNLESAMLTGVGLDQPFLSRPVSVNLKVSNTGTETVVPNGAIIVKSWLGNFVTTIPVNPLAQRVVPGASKTFSLEWKDQSPFRIGIYSLELSTDLDQVPGAKNIWHVIILPWRLLVLVILLAIVAKFVHAKFGRNVSSS